MRSGRDKTGTDSENRPIPGTYLFVVHGAEGTPSEASREAIKVQAARRSHADWRRLHGIHRSKRNARDHLEISDIVVDRKRPSRPPQGTSEEAQERYLASHEGVRRDFALTPITRDDMQGGIQQPHIRSPTLRPFTFNEYSVQRTPFVQDIMTFLTSVYLPATCKRSRFRGKGQDQAYLRDLYPRIVADEMLLSSLIVFAYVMRDVAFSMNRRFTAEAFHHWTRAIALLRSRIAQFDRSDELLWTISAMVSTGNVLRRGSEASTHFEALETVAAQRLDGGGHATGQDPSPPLNTVPALGAYSGGAGSLPVGFWQLHYSGLVTPQLTQLVADLLTSMSWQDGEDLAVHTLSIEQYGAHIARTFIYLRDVPINERSLIDELVALSLLGFLIYASSSEFHYFEIANGYLQCRCYSLLHRDFTTCSSEVLVWSASMLIAAFGQATVALDLGQMLLSLTETSEGPAGNVNLRKFIWTSALSERLLQAKKHQNFDEVQFEGNALRDLVQAYTSKKSLTVRSMFVRSSPGTNS